MHTINKTRDGKSMLRIWRFQPNSFMTKAARSFAEKTRDAVMYARRLGRLSPHA